MCSQTLRMHNYVTSNKQTKNKYTNSNNINNGKHVQLYYFVPCAILRSLLKLVQKLLNDSSEIRLTHELPLLDMNDKSNVIHESSWSGLIYSHTCVFHWCSGSYLELGNHWKKSPYWHCKSPCLQSRPNHQCPTQVDWWYKIYQVHNMAPIS